MNMELSFYYYFFSSWIKCCALCCCLGNCAVSASMKHFVLLFKRQVRQPVVGACYSLSLWCMLSYLLPRCMCQKHVPLHFHVLWLNSRGTGFSRSWLPQKNHHCSAALCQWTSAKDKLQLVFWKQASTDQSSTLSSRLGSMWKTRGSVWPLLTLHSWNVLATTSGAPKNPPVTTARLGLFASSLPISLGITSRKKC